MNYDNLFHLLEVIPEAKAWLEVLPKQIDDYWIHFANPLVSYKDALEKLPDIAPSVVDIVNAVKIGNSSDVSVEVKELLQEQLGRFHPWRKGPLDFFGIYIDTEWRSDWKWDRLIEHISSLEYRTVLDVGCGNGYYCWRMRGAGAKLVVGVDPILGYIMQFFAAAKYIGDKNVHVVPGKMENIPMGLGMFDTVFSMGVLYHRRSPLDHLNELKLCLRSQGELILETLVVDGALGHCLLPEKRYARMNNVWFIPSVLTLESWLKRIGFKDIRIVDVNQTSTEEQRATKWMSFESLIHCLDQNDKNLTIEGLPAPKRAILIANAP